MRLAKEKIDLDNCAVVDFESYYDDTLSITTMGYTRYIRATDLYMVSVVSDSLQWVGHPDEFDWSLLKGKDLIAHNASFDQHIIDLKGYVQYDDFLCTADLAAFLQSPRDLARATWKLLKRKVSKSMRAEAKGKRWPQDFTSEQRTAMRDYALSDSQCSWDIFTKYIHTWPLFERKLSRITRIMGWNGVPVHREDLEAAVTVLEKAKHEALNKLPWYGEIDPKTRKPYADLSTNALTHYCLKNGIKPPTSRARDSVKADEWIEQYGDKFEWVQVMQDVNALNTHLTKAKAMADRVVGEGVDTRMLYALKYYGAATTARWSGDKGFNTQNITKGVRHGVNLRKLIRCHGKNRLGCVDLSNIEPRCLYFLAGDGAPLDLVRTGLDLYEAHARLTMGYDEPLPLKRPDSDPQQARWSKYRDLAKVRVLQLGYGSGWHKLYLSAREYNQLHVFDEDYSSEDRKWFLDFVIKYNTTLIPVVRKADGKTLRHYVNAFKQVMDFREKSPKITGLWKSCQERLADAVGGDLEVELPSGRVMRYFNVRMGKDGIECQTIMGGPFYKAYGAKLVENLCQATGRDVFATGLLRVVEELGYIPVLQVHDELAIEEDLSKIEAVNQSVERIFSQTPSWLGDTPLASESHVTEYYTKK